MKTEKDKIFQGIIIDQIQLLTEETAKVKSLLNFVPELSKPKAMFIRQEFKGKIKGVYKIIYKPHYESEDGNPYVMYIGQGNVNERHQRHKSVFLNNGQDIVSGNGHVSPSQAGKKMYMFDSDRNNWLFSYCKIGIKSLCSRYEEALQNEENPIFNNSSMAGCN